MRKKLVQAKDIQGRDKPLWLNIGSVWLKDDGASPHQRSIVRTDVAEQPGSE